MAVCPFAVNKLIPPGSNDPRIRARAVVLHVAATRASSLWGYFAHRSGGIESHFYIRLSGVIEQYRDTDWQADANLKANDFAVSIETAGLAGGRWNRRQRKSIKRLLLWLHEVHGIPLEKIAAWDGEGVGYHTQFGAPGPWTPYAKTCPGPRRIVQYNRWLVPWLAKVAQPTPPAPAPVTTLTFISANLWKDNPAPVQDLRVLADTHADIIGVQEGHRFLHQLRSLSGYQCFDEPHRSHGCQILVRNGIEVVEHGGERISHAVGASPGRHMTWVVYKHRGSLRAHVNTHMNAHVQKDADTPRHIPRVREYIAGAKVVAAKVQELQDQGYAVTVTGDLNWAFSPGRSQWWWAPRLVFGRLGLLSQFEAASNPVRPKGDKREVEYVLYDPDDLAILSQRLVPGEHSDHPWHEVTFTYKGA